MPPKTFDVVVSTMDSEMEFSIDVKMTGQQLFDQVVHTIGLRETWYFDLSYTEPNGNMQWLKRHKKVLVQDVPRVQPIPFRLLVKFYPEDVEEELIQDITQHLFFLQVKQSVVRGDIFCPAEASVLLASYAVQAKFGDYSEAIHKRGFLADEIRLLLPQRVVEQYQMTMQMWEDRVTACFSEHRGMARDEAEMEYLKIAQDLEMYGVNYFEIKNKKETSLFLGVDALGLNIYRGNDKLSPQIAFPWSEIKNIAYHDRKFTIKSSDDKTADFSFFATRLDVNKLILQLCVGNHELYIRRRNLDTMEVQQMKAVAKEDKVRRAAEQARLLKEREHREMAERDKQRLSQRLEKLKKQAVQAQRDLIRSEETAQLLAEKIEIAEVETGLLLRKSHEAEAAYERVKQEKAKTDEEKRQLERKAVDAEDMARKMSEDAARRQAEVQALSRQLEAARLAEREARQQLVTLSTTSSTAGSRVMSPNIVAGLAEGFGSGSDTASAADAEEPEANAATVNFSAAPAQADAGRAFQAKSETLQKQLRELKTDMEGLQRPEAVSAVERAYRDKSGESKFDTMKRIRHGSTKARVSFFEEL